MSFKKVLVTGSSGFIGYELCNLFLKKRTHISNKFVINHNLRLISNMKEVLK